MDGAQKELNVALDYLEKLANEDPEIMRKKVYESFSGISFLIVEAKHANFKKGWASKLVDRYGNKLFTSEESRILELNANKFLKPIIQGESLAKGQEGGAEIKPTGTPSVIEPKGGIDLDELSLDKTMWNLTGFFTAIDKKVKLLSKELGPFKFFYKEDSKDFIVPFPVPMPTPPFIAIVQVPLNPRAVPVIIGLVIEAIRITYSVGPLSNDLTRRILSLVLGLVDLLKGDWIQSILSVIGFFGESPLLAGLVGKVIFNIFELTAPDLRGDMIMNLYKSSKSAIAGFFLWGFANFAPEFERIQARQQFDKIAAFRADSNNEIQKVQDSIQKSLDSKGLVVNFNKIPANFVPTFDDIQNLQVIVREPVIACSKEFQDIVEPLKRISLMRLILELMNVPTDAQTLERECGAKAGKPLEETMGDLAQPTITSSVAMATPEPEPVASPEPVAMAEPAPEAMASPEPEPAPESVAAPVKPSPSK